LDKIAFNDPYRFLAQIFRGAETLFRKRERPNGSLAFGDARNKGRVTKEETRCGDRSFSLAI
jgi:hypothetical protein